MQKTIKFTPNQSGEIDLSRDEPLFKLMLIIGAMDISSKHPPSYFTDKEGLEYLSIEAGILASSAHDATRMLGIMLESEVRDEVGLGDERNLETFGWLISFLAELSKFAASNQFMMAVQLEGMKE
jgi:hypothetical protein